MMLKLRVSVSMYIHAPTCRPLRRTITRVRAACIFPGSFTKRAQKRRAAPGTLSTGLRQTWVSNTTPHDKKPASLAKWLKARLLEKWGWSCRMAGAFFFFFLTLWTFVFTEQSGQMMKHMAPRANLPSQAHLALSLTPNSRGQEWRFQPTSQEAGCVRAVQVREVNTTSHPWQQAEREEPFKPGQFSCTGR